MKQPELWAVMLYEKIEKDDPFYNGEAKALECFLFENRKPTEEDIKELKRWYIYEMYPSLKPEDIICIVRRGRSPKNDFVPNTYTHFACPADIIMDRYKYL